MTEAGKEAHKESERRRRYRRLYGITVEQYDAHVAAQGGTCAICGTAPEQRLAVDHDHDTGAVRGLLCFTCNAGLGLLGDSVVRLARALAYLTTPPKSGTMGRRKSGTTARRRS